MTLRSMTGFGSAQLSRDGWTVTVQCRSVNHRALDINLNIPGSFWSQEQAIRHLIRQFCGRGRIDFTMAIDRAGPVELTPLARSQVREVHRTLMAIKEELAIEGPIELHHLFALGLSSTGLVDNRPDDPSTLDLVMATASNALVALLAVRETEGQTLRDDFLQRLDLIRSLLVQVQENAPPLMEASRDRLSQKVLDWMQKMGGIQPIEPERIYREVASLLEKSDINEELVRAFSHVEALKERIGAAYPPGETAGKGIDFFVQELSRELNTISAKCSGSAVTQEVVRLKLETERMREQVQNIE